MVAHGGRFCHLGVVTNSRNIQKSGEKDSDSGGGAHCDDGEA